MSAKSEKLRCYPVRGNQYRQNVVVVAFYYYYYYYYYYDDDDDDHHHHHHHNRHKAYLPFKNIKTS